MTQHAGNATFAGVGAISGNGTALRSLQPDADSIDGGWTDQVGGTSLFAAVDEMIADDADYIRSAGDPVVDVCKIALSNPSGAAPAEPFIVIYRYKKAGSNPIDLGVRLLQGVTEIAAWSHSDVGTEFIIAEQTLTGPQFAAISDFNDLFIEFTGDTVGYLGPGDIVAGATAWWGLRAYSTATIGSNAVRLRRDSDNVESDFATLASGDLDVASIATFKGAANLFVVKLYDQTNNGFDAVQATAANQPAFTLNGLGSLPTMDLFGDPSYAFGQFLLTAAISAHAQPFTYTAVARNTAATNPAVMGSNLSEAGGTLRDFGTSITVNAGSVPSVSVSSGFHATQVLFSGAASNVYVNGSANIVDAGTNSYGGGGMNIGNESFGGFFTGSILEAGFWTSDVSGSFSALDSNQRAYWQI